MNRSDWIAIAAGVISLLSAAFSGLQWLEQREQRRQEFSATLGFDIDTELDHHRAGIAVRNVGPGVARISSVTYYLDGRPIDDASDGFDAVGLDSDRDTGVDLDRGDSMAPGEIDWLVRFQFKRRDEEDRARDLFDNRLRIAVEYCSANGACTRQCSVHGACPAAPTS